MRALVDRLRAQRSEYASTDKEWVQFVKDHRAALLRNSVTVRLSIDTMARYRFRIEEYLDSLGTYDRALAWIVLWINGLPSNLEFDGLAELILPNRPYLEQLRMDYQSFVSDYNPDFSTT